MKLQDLLQETISGISTNKFKLTTITERIREITASLNPIEALRYE